MTHIVNYEVNWDKKRGPNEHLMDVMPTSADQSLDFFCALSGLGKLFYQHNIFAKLSIENLYFI